MSSYRAQGILAIGFGALALSACADTPDLDTNLRPEGDPEVLAVMIQTDQTSPNGGVPEEKATFCKDNDAKVPTFIGLPDFSVVQVCPDPEDSSDDFTVGTVDNADPLLWQVRFVFDELLDTDVETLTDGETGGACTEDSSFCEGHIDVTQPVTVNCGGTAIAYDGYYAPNGNNVSWPPGPSLVVQPADFVATGSTCTISIDEGAVTDKDGNPVPSDQLGDYDFEIADLALLGTDPEDGATGVAPDVEILVTFNAPISGASVTAGEITLAVAGGGAAVPATITADGTDLIVTPDAELAPGDYELTIAAAATFEDIAGGPLTTGDAVVVAFTVEAAAAN